jgi:hypothetical protein
MPNKSVYRTHFDQSAPGDLIVETSGTAITEMKCEIGTLIGYDHGLNFQFGL